jgi:hypothetical protein
LSSASLTDSGQSPPPLRAQFEQMAVDRLDVVGQRETLRHIFVADVAIGDQPHPQLGVRPFVENGGGDRPDLALGAFDQTRHRAGRVSR